MDVKKKLKQVNKAWKDAYENKDSAFGNTLDDGRYITQVTAAEVQISKSDSKRLQVMIEFTVTDGEHKGESVRNYVGLNSPEGISILQNTLMRLGVEVPEDSDALADVLEELATSKKIVRITLKTKSTAKGDFQNIYVDKVMGVAEGTDVTNSKSDEDEDEDSDEEDEEDEDSDEEDEDEDSDEEDEDEDSDEDSDEEVELKIGQTVEVKYKNKEVIGIVKKIDEDKGGALILLKKAKKKKFYPFEEISFLEEDEKPEPKKKVRKK